MNGRTKIVLVGAGGGTSELVGLVRHALTPWDLLGILDDNPSMAGKQVAGITVVGTLADAGRYQDALFLSGIANFKSPALRLKIADRVALPPDRWATFIHPAAVVLDRRSVGSGSIIYPGAVVSSGASVGEQVVMYYNAVLHHDSSLGDGCCVCASVTVAGGVKVGKGCYLGAASALRERIVVGAGALIGMGAVVLGDVPAGGRVAGVPARQITRKELP